MRVAVIGHVEWIWFGAVDRIPGPGDIAHATDEWEEPGGGGAVAAVQLAKLAGACDFLTALGDDDLGERAAKELAGLGLTMHVATRADRTRRALTLVDPAGERTITTLGRRLEPRGEDDLPWELLDGADAVYVTAGDADAFRRARRARVMVVTSRALEELLDADVVPDALVGSRRDPAEHVDQELLPWRPPLLVRTEGTSGGRYETAGGVAGRYEAVEVSRGLAGDAYGAGDSFAAGLTFGLGSGWQVDRALAFAARCGAACASGRGPYAGQWDGT
ncbi:MAG TPA: PfkB family carbohydrate kinase [Actinomycetota bacterium]|nr:PfkB family carbohydrate kinase [Actinomycetota bacterium]